MPKKKKAPPKKRPVARQQKLDGVMPENPAIEKAAVAYVIARDHRMELTKDEVGTRATLLQVMKNAGLLTYTTTEGFTCLITAGEEKVRVKSPAGEDGDGEDGE